MTKQALVAGDLAKALASSYLTYGYVSLDKIPTAKELVRPASQRPNGASSPPRKDSVRLTRFPFPRLASPNPRVEEELNMANGFVARPLFRLLSPRSVAMPPSTAV